MSRKDARRAAMRAFAGLEQRKEECRDIRRLNFADNLMRDVRYALRSFIKYPVFTCAAIVTLTLGIGANAAVFTMVNSVLLRQLPFKHAERLVWIWSTRTDRDKASTRFRTSSTRARGRGHSMRLRLLRIGV